MAGRISVYKAVFRAIPLVGIVHAQSATQGSPKFEMASVTTFGVTDGARKVSSDSSLGAAQKRVSFSNVNLFALIVQAYGIRGCRSSGTGNCVLISGGPSWLRKDGFTIVAKIPDDVPDQTVVQLMNGHAPQLQLMLRALLEDRFALKVHHETKELSVYALTVGKNGTKLQKSDGSKEPRIMFRPPLSVANGPKMLRLAGENGSMQELVDLYAKFMDRAVVDRTGLKERYDFTVDYEANADAPGPLTELTGPGLFKSFEEQLGLKWVATKGPVDILVIDHAERPPAN